MVKSVRNKRKKEDFISLVEVLFENGKKVNWFILMTLEHKKSLQKSERLEKC